MVKKSAGLLMFRHRQGSVEVFLVHPGGPFWAKKDEGAWSIPKREYDPGEDPLDAAKREFQEETGFSPGGEFLPLAPPEAAERENHFGVGPGRGLRTRWFLLEKARP